MGEMRNTYVVLIVGLERKRPLGDLSIDSTMILNASETTCGSRCRPGSSAYGNESPGSIKGGDLVA
jgi:hypothetical protein